MPAAPQSPTSTPSLSAIRGLLASGQYALAETDLRQLVQTGPQQTEPHFLLAFTLFKLRRPQESLDAYTEAARFRRPDAEDFIVIASDYVLLKSYPDAQHWLTVATTIAPRNVSAWYLLGRTEYQLDHPDAARLAFLQCLTLDPAHLRAQYNLGLALERLQQPAKAQEAYGQAIAMQAGSTHPDPQPDINLGGPSPWAEPAAASSAPPRACR